MTANQPMTAAQTATLKRLAQDAYELRCVQSEPHQRRGGYTHHDANG